METGFSLKCRSFVASLSLLSGAIFLLSGDSIKICNNRVQTVYRVRFIRFYVANADHRHWIVAMYRIHRLFILSIYLPFNTNLSVTWMKMISVIFVAFHGDCNSMVIIPYIRYSWRWNWFWITRLDGNEIKYSKQFGSDWIWAYCEEKAEALCSGCSTICLALLNISILHVIQ